MCSIRALVVDATDIKILPENASCSSTRRERRRSTRKRIPSRSISWLFATTNKAIVDAHCCLAGTFRLPYPRDKRTDGERHKNGGRCERAANRCAKGDPRSRRRLKSPNFYGGLSSHGAVATTRFIRSDSTHMHLVVSRDALPFLDTWKMRLARIPPLKWRLWDFSNAVNGGRFGRRFFVCET